MTDYANSSNYWNRRIGRRTALRSSALFGTGLAGVALLGCGDDDGPAATTATPDAGASPAATPISDDGNGNGEARSGGSIGLFSTEAGDNFNPIVQSAEANYLSAWHAYDRLLSPRLDDRVYVLEAAESVETPDDTTIVFTLKEGLVYQDKEPVNGRAVTSEDIATVQEYILANPDRAFDTTLQELTEGGIETPDDHTIVFNLREPFAYVFGADAGFGRPSNMCIIPSELVLGDLDQMEPVGSGPYQLESYQFGVRYEYERNPTYRRAEEGMPYIDRRTLLPMTDGAAMEAAFRSEQIHNWRAVPPEAASRIVNDLGDDLEVTEYVGLNLFVWAMSAEREWTQDIRAREAFYRAFDAQEHIDLAFDGWAVPATGKLAQGMDPAYLLDEAESAEYLRHDPDEARALLEAAGWDFDQVYTGTTLGGANNEASLQVFQEQWRRIGVQTDLDVRPTSEWLPNVARTGDYDLIGGAGKPAYDTPYSALRYNHSDPRSINASMWTGDPEIDAMIEESERTLDREENTELVKEIQRALLREYGRWSLVLTRVERDLRWNYLRDWEFSPTSAVVFRAEAWLDA